MRSLARFSFRHRRIVLGAWLLAVVGMTFLSRAVGTGYSNSFTLPKTESTKPGSTDRLPRLRGSAPRSGDQGGSEPRAPRDTGLRSRS
jgi:hypothetical protein